MSENHLWHSVPQFAVMVNLGESEIFVRHVPQLANRSVDVAVALLHVLKEGSQSLVVHWRSSGGS